MHPDSSPTFQPHFGSIPLKPIVSNSHLTCMQILLRIHTFATQTQPNRLAWPCPG